jgi:hypothetical protein
VAVVKWRLAKKEEQFQFMGSFLRGASRGKKKDPIYQTDPSGIDGFCPFALLVQ